MHELREGLGSPCQTPSFATRPKLPPLLMLLWFLSCGGKTRGAVQSTLCLWYLRKGSQASEPLVGGAASAWVLGHPPWEAGLVIKGRKGFTKESREKERMALSFSYKRALPLCMPSHSALSTLLGSTHFGLRLIEEEKSTEKLSDLPKATQLTRQGQGSMQACDSFLISPGRSSPYWGCGYGKGLLSSGRASWPG